MMKKHTQEISPFLIKPYDLRTGSQLVIGEKSYLDFSSWDPFGLAQNKKFNATVAKALGEVGLSAQASRTSTGTSPAHLACENRFAQFFRAERGLLFSSRSQLVLSLITALCDNSWCILSDERSESPIADAAALAGITHVPIRQNDPKNIFQELQKTSKFKNRILFIEYIQGFTGESLNISPFTSENVYQNLYLCFDETLSVGLSGLRGAGSAEIHNLAPLPILRYLGFDRHLALNGAMLIGPEVILNLLLEKSRYLKLEVAPPPFLAIAAREALDQLELHVAKRAKIFALAEKMRAAIKNIRWTILSKENSGLICLALKSNAESLELFNALKSQGILVDRHTALLPGSEIFGIRFILRADHSESDITKVCSSLWDIHKRFL